jgi:hypothetical protein
VTRRHMHPIPTYEGTPRQRGQIATGPLQDLESSFEKKLYRKLFLEQEEMRMSRINESIIKYFWTVIDAFLEVKI